jgi:hypothetical protein
VSLAADVVTASDEMLLLQLFGLETTSHDICIVILPHYTDVIEQDAISQASMLVNW